MYGYLKRNPDGAIRFRIGIPDHESREMPVQYDWINSVYGPNPEELPDNMPTPLGKPFRTTTYEDANLVHCLVTGRSMSGIIHLVNQTPIQWFCKKQNVVETATYGSEFMVARQATEQIMDLRYTLRMMGIPIDGPSWMFGDNQSVVTSSTIPHSNLNKRHNALSYHRVREAISAGILYFLHIDGKLNPSDVLTKFLTWAKFWPLIQPMLFWKGETVRNIHPNLPMTQVIEALTLAASSGLRGVSSNSSISPSDTAKESLISASPKPKPAALRSVSKSVRPVRNPDLVGTTKIKRVTFNDECEILSASSHDRHNSTEVPVEDATESSRILQEAGTGLAEDLHMTSLNVPGHLSSYQCGTDSYTESHTSENSTGTLYLGVITDPGHFSKTVKEIREN
jgi:hypothetical protein